MQWLLSPISKVLDMQITERQLNEIKDQVEDSLAYICDIEMISGEAGWAVVQSLATVKLAQIKGRLAAR